MPNYTALVATCGDSLLAIDKVVNVLHFTDAGATTDPTNLATQVVAAYQGYYGSVTRQIECTIYDDSDDKPRPQKGYFIANKGIAPMSSGPREVSLCLSFYGDRNLPRTRGRIYLCPTFKGSLNVRPAAVQITPALDLATALGDVGGVDVDWVIYSPTSGQYSQVQTAYVDDEWDAMRSRGLRSTARTLRALQ